MRLFIIMLACSALMFGCVPEKKKPAPVVKQNTVKTQQMNADAAQAEMESDIKKGTPTLVDQPVVKQEEKPVMPVKTVNTLSSLKPQTKYPIKNGYPEWFYSTVYDGYIGAVGIAQKQPNGSITAQKKVARMQAQKNLAKQIEVLVRSEVTVESLNVDAPTVKYYREKVSTLTKENADQFLTGFKVMDEWTDENTGEYYIWMVLEK